MVGIFFPIFRIKNPAEETADRSSVVDPNPKESEYEKSSDLDSDPDIVVK
jgi:hypothetical protein